MLELLLGKCWLGKWFWAISRDLGCLDLQGSKAKGRGTLLSPGSCWVQQGGEGAQGQAEGARAPQTHS